MTAVDWFDNDSHWLIRQWQLLTDCSDNDSCWLIDLTMTAVDWSDNDSYRLNWQLLIDWSDNDSYWLIDLTMTATDRLIWQWQLLIDWSNNDGQAFSVHHSLSHTENPWRWKAQIHIVGDPSENCRKRPHASLLIQSKPKWCTHTCMHTHTRMHTNTHKTTTTPSKKQKLHLQHLYTLTKRCTQNNNKIQLQDRRLWISWEEETFRKTHNLFTGRTGGCTLWWSI